MHYRLSVVDASFTVCWRIVIWGGFWNGQEAGCVQSDLASLRRKGRI